MSPAARCSLATGKAAYTQLFVAGRTEVVAQRVQILAHIIALLPGATRIVIWLNGITGSVRLPDQGDVDAPACQTLCDAQHVFNGNPAPAGGIGFIDPPDIAGDKTTRLDDVPDQPGQARPPANPAVGCSARARRPSCTPSSSNF